MFRKLRAIAAPSGTPFEHQSTGYAFGYVEAMLEKGHVEEARDKLDWLKNALARTGHTRRGVPYVGGPYDSGHNPDGEIDAVRPGSPLWTTLDCRSHGEVADVPPRPERGGWT
ncbi:hypothetical protein [Streptomyces sp. NPDC096152]|uniref:hypothetical protein n=1 Tax=Streptomyces sp. NPDC096152 TaxID=3366078 RepID=UPI00382E4C15